MSDTLNILHLPTRIDREVSFLKEMQEQEIEYKVWNGFKIDNLTFLSVNLGHKRIVRWAKENKLPYVIVAEDDLKFTAAGAWKYFLDNKPAEFDLYLSMVYDGDIDDNNRIKTDFSSLTMYIVHERFYDTYLGVKDMNNIDRELGKLAYNHKYIVCNPMVCYQEDGYSDRKAEYHTYGHLLKGRKMFGVD